MIKRVLLFVGLFMFLMPVGNAFAEHGYDLNGIDIHPTNSQINNFINKYEYVFPLKFTPPNSNSVRLNLFGSNTPFTYEYLSESDEFMVYNEKFYIMVSTGNLSTENPIYNSRASVDISKRKFYTTEIGGRNDANVHFDMHDIEDDDNPPDNINNIEHTVTSSSVHFVYDLPDSDNFSHVEIQANGNTYETTNDTFTLDNLKSDTEYDVTFYTVLDGIKSEGITVTVKTDKKPPNEKEVTNVKAKTKHNRVDLSWDLPESDEFEHVTIYRKMLENNTSSIFNFLVPKTYASDAYDPIFETNGTYFNDLTVEAATGYEYKLTSTHDGKETPGVTVQATTDPPIVEGGGIEKNENGDYVYKWHEPTTGQVKIYVDGNEYATADASDGKITIPADDMKYNGFGDPLVTSQAIAPNGTPGNIGNGSGGTLAGIVLPFEVNDLVESGNSLIYLVGGFVLLALSFLLIPRLIRLIRQSFNSYKNSGQDRRVRG